MSTFLQFGRIFDTYGRGVESGTQQCERVADGRWLCWQRQGKGMLRVRTPRSRSERVQVQ